MVKSNTYTTIIADPTVTNVKYVFEIIVLDVRNCYVDYDEEQARIYIIKRSKEVH